MTWNYRIIYHDDHKFPYYGLHEVYYDKEINIKTWTLDAQIVGDDVKDLVSTLKMMLKDAKKYPVLIHSELEVSDEYR